MVNWTKVNVGFDAEDETLNFGPRTVVENDGSIYETSTKATIQCNDPDDLREPPSVKAAFSQSMLCVIIDDSITVFADETCQQIMISVEFQSPITAHCVSPKGEMLLVAVEKGIIHGINLTPTSEQKYCINILEKFGCDSIIHLQFEDEALLIVTSDGKILKVSAILDNINDIISEETIDLLEDRNSRVTAVMYQEEAEGKSALVTLGEEIFLWPKGRKSSVNFRYVKAQFFENYGALLCLREIGHLDVVCRQTLFAMTVFQGPVKDFMTVNEQNEEFHILILMCPEELQETTSLYLMKFPSFQVKLSMTVPKDTFLVELSGIIEHLVFLEGASASGQLDTLRVKSIEESLPEFRLQRLLRRQKFYEAQAFARKFELDVESVFHAEAMMLMERLRPSVHSKEYVHVQEFMEILDKIQNVTFVYNCCKNAMARDLNDSKKLVIYAKKRIVNFMTSEEYHEENSEENLEKLLSYVNDTLRKLETFEIVHSGSPGDDEIDEWSKFSETDLLEECIKHLFNGELHAAALIWIRHLPEISPRVNSETVLLIFKVIPENLPPSSLWPWLHEFIPSLTSFYSHGLSNILQWAYNRTKSMEIHQRQAWPEVGLEFANGLINLLKFDRYDVCMQLQREHSNKTSDLHQLLVLIQAMSDLAELKSNYTINVPLQTYLGNPTEVVHLLLMKIQVNDIPRLMEDFLKNYMIKHNLKNDSVISELVQKVLKKSKAWWICDRAPWDRRLVQVIDFIHNIKNKLVQTLDVLKRAPVPWSESITALAEKSYVFNHSLVNLIRVEASSVSFKLILKKYCFAHVGVCPTLYKRMILEDRKDVVADLLELTKQNDQKRRQVFSNCVNHHIRAGNLDRVLELLETLPKNVTKFLAQSIAASFQTRMNFTQIWDETLENYTEILQVLQRKNFLNEIPALRCLFNLRKEFGIYITLNQYLTDKHELLLTFISELIEKKHNSLEKVQRVAKLFGFSRITGIWEFLEATANTVIIKQFLKERMSSWEILGVEEVECASKMILKLLGQVQDEPELARAFKILMHQSVAYSSEEFLEEAIQIAERVNVFGHAVSQPLEQEALIFPIFKDASICAGDVLVPYLNDLNEICEAYEERLTHRTDLAKIKALQQNLMLRTKSLMNEHHDLAIVKILMAVHIRMSQLPLEFIEEVNAIRKILIDAMTILLKKVIEHPVFDMYLGLACLLQVPSDMTIQLLFTCMDLYDKDRRRVSTFKSLSLEFFKLTENTKLMKKFETSLVLDIWAIRLAPYGIEYKDVLTSNNDDKRNFSKQIMMFKKPNALEILKDFCTDFGFLFSDCCLQYLEILLTTWTPKFQVTNLHESPTKIKIDDDQIKSLALECNRVAENIIDKDALKNLITQLLSTPLINFYYYEAFLIALRLAEFPDRQTWTVHLCFLQSYTRVAAPTEIELDAWLHWSQEQELPEIAKWRLPFLPKAEFFKLITPELNLKTYDQWLGIAPTLHVPLSNICTLAVRNAADEEWRKARSTAGTWNINSRNNTFLNKVRKCLKSLPQMDRLQYGTASLYYLMNKTPPGADLVAVCKQCLLYMEEWKSICPEEADPANKFDKIKKKYLHNMAKHILYSHGLGIPKYLALVHQPPQLFSELYKDESIPQRYRNATKMVPDINNAVIQLGDIFHVDLPSIRTNLLQEWLQPEPEYPSNYTPDVVIKSGAAVTDTEVFETDDNLLKACYIVECGDTNTNLAFLMHVAFDTSENFKPGMRFRALRVIESLTTEDSLEKYTKCSLIKFKQYMRTLQYLMELQRVGIGYSVPGFQQCSKKRLVLVLINVQYCVPRALALVPQLFLDYDLEDFDVLNMALERMVNLSLVDVVRKALVILGNLDRLTNYHSYAAAWQLVISNGFSQLNARVENETLDHTEQALRLLHTCPVVDKLDFGEIVDNCLGCRQFHFAVALLPFLGVQQRALVILTIVEQEAVDETLRNLLQLTERGLLIVKQSEVIFRKMKDEFLNENSSIKRDSVE